MEIRVAGQGELPFLSSRDRHIERGELETLLALGRVMVAQEDGETVGWLRWNLFWDNTPFLNLLFVLEGRRGCGVGTALLARWEDQMKGAGHPLVLTSTLSSEGAQHFYRRRGYTDAGALLLPGEALEIFFVKAI